MWPTFYIPSLLRAGTEPVENIYWACSPMADAYDSTDRTFYVLYPTDIQAGDLMILDVSTSDSSTGGITMPTGFEKLMAMSQPGPFAYKFADGTETGSLGVTVRAAQNGRVYKICMAVFRGASQTDPFGAVSMTGGNTHINPSIMAPPLYISDPNSHQMVVTQTTWDDDNPVGIEGHVVVENGDLDGGAAFRNTVNQFDVRRENTYMFYSPSSRNEVDNLLSNHVEFDANWSTSLVTLNPATSAPATFSGTGNGVARRGIYQTVALEAGKHTFAIGGFDALGANINFYLACVAPDGDEATAWFIVNASMDGVWGRLPTYESGDMTLLGRYLSRGQGSGDLFRSKGGLAGISFEVPEAGNYELWIVPSYTEGTRFPPATNYGMSVSWAAAARGSMPIWPAPESWSASGAAFTGAQGVRGRGIFQNPDNTALLDRDMRAMAFEILPTGATRSATLMRQEPNYLKVLQGPASGNVVVPDYSDSRVFHTNQYEDYVPLATTQCRGRAIGGSSRVLYAEFQFGSGAGANCYVQLAGLKSRGHYYCRSNYGQPVRQDLNGIYVGSNNAILKYDGTTVLAAAGSAWTSTDWIGVEYDIGAGTVRFYKNGTALAAATTLPNGDDLFQLIAQTPFTNSFTSITEVAANFTGPFGGRKPSGAVAWDWYNDVP